MVLTETLAPIEARKTSRPVLSRFVAALLLFLLVDTLIFKTDFYSCWIEPISAAGVFRERMVEVSNLQNAASHHEDAKAPRLVCFMGDSRMSEGFSEKAFDNIALASAGYKAVSLAMPGSTPRVWFYLLNKVDPKGDAFDAIVLPMPSYDFYGVHLEADPADRDLDLRVLLPVLNSLELIDFCGTIHSAPLKLEVLFNVLIRMSAYRNDIAAFVANPVDRMQRIKLQNKYAGIGDYNYQGVNGSLDGVVVVDGKMTAAPASLPTSLIADINRGLSQIVTAERINQNNAYLEFWLNRILAKYHNSRTKIVIVRIPSNPFRDNRLDKTSPFLQKLAERPDIRLLNSDAFTSFEQPKYFHDLLHLNSQGRIEFSKALTPQLIQCLQGSHP